MNDRGVLPDVVERFLDAPVAAPHVEGLRAAGAVVVRRRRRRAVTGAAAAALLVVGGVAVGQAALRGDHRDRADDPVPATTTVDPPAGTRWAGIGRVVIAVPKNWGDGQVECFNQAVADTVFFWDDDAPWCRPARSEPSSSLAISDHAFGTPHDPGPLVDGQVDGHDVVVHGQLCAQPTVMTCGMDVSVPDLGAYFRITLHGTDVDEGLRAMRDTLTVLPETQVAVPPVDGWRRPQVDEAVAAMQGLGLDPVVEEGCNDASLCDIGAWTTPAAGRVVTTGTSVTIRVVGWGDPSSPAAFGGLQCKGNQISGGTFDFVLPSTAGEAHQQGWPTTARQAAQSWIDGRERRFGPLTLSRAMRTDSGAIQYAGVDADGLRVLLVTVEEFLDDAWAVSNENSCA
jgi:hypothetical protein